MFAGGNSRTCSVLPRMVGERAQTKGVGVIFSFLAEPHTVDELAANFAENDVETAEPPVDRPWNTQDIVEAEHLGCRLAHWSRESRKEG